jgi:hypothetical protein
MSTITEMTEFVELCDRVQGFNFTNRSDEIVGVLERQPTKGRTRGRRLWSR